MTASGRRIAILGAESTGKSTLARELAQRLAVHTGARVACVDEGLRAWCDRECRTPRCDEQAAIAHDQQARIEHAAASHDWVVADTTALMTAVYSNLIFDDHRIDAYAVEQQRTMDATLLTALDLPWMADGHQRDGPQVRDPVDRRVRELLVAHGIGFSVIGGSGSTRLEQAWAALGPLLRRAMSSEEAGRIAATGGAFTRLLEPAAGSRRRTRRTWWCECCVPDAEQAGRVSSRDWIPAAGRSQE